jgi:hypothetical protein
MKKYIKTLNNFIFEEKYSNLNFLDVTFEIMIEILKNDFNFLKIKTLQNFKERFLNTQEIIKNIWNHGKFESLTQNEVKKIQNFISLPKEENEINSEIKKIQIDFLHPIQNEIFLSSVLNNISDSEILEKIKNSLFICSSDLFLLDGHHKWVSSMILDPKITITVLQINLTLNEVLEKIKK